MTLEKKIAHWLFEIHERKAREAGITLTEYLKRRFADEGSVPSKS